MWAHDLHVRGSRDAGTVRGEADFHRARTTTRAQVRKPFRFGPHIDPAFELALSLVEDGRIVHRMVAACGSRRAGSQNKYGQGQLLAQLG